MRMSEGRETFNRLLNWDRGQAPSERLAAIILSKEGFKGVDPSHPLGGKDGLKDMTLSFDGKRWIGAVYFPRGQQSFSDIKDKFAHDLDGVKANNAEGLAFVTNQELRLGERKILSELMPEVDVQIYHLERIASLLNTPSFYGIRMEFLDIEMSKEEQLSFFADQDQRLARIESTLEQMAIGLDGYKPCPLLLQQNSNRMLRTKNGMSLLTSLVQWTKSRIWQMSSVKRFGLIAIYH